MKCAAALEAVLGFKVSSTAVQRTTEKTGERIHDAPDELTMSSVSSSHVP